jgi:chromosome segregation ATPase
MTTPAASHPVFSDFTHLASDNSGSLGTLTFAVGLRTEDPEEAVRKMLPLSFITPGVKLERVIRAVATDQICERVDCVQRREFLQELDGQNEDLRVQVQDMQNRILAAKNKVALTEKSLAITEEKNDSLKAEIDEAQQLISQMESEVEKSQEHNDGLRTQVDQLQGEINTMRTKVDEEASMIDIMEQGNNEIVFQHKPQMTVERQTLRAEVSFLGRAGPQDEDDSDDDF